eukprot:4744566-Amphidinium_carterae.1
MDQRVPVDQPSQEQQAATVEMDTQKAEASFLCLGLFWGIPGFPDSGLTLGSMSQTAAYDIVMLQ